MVKPLYLHINYVPFTRISWSIMFLNIQNDSEIYYLHFNIYFFTNVFNLRLTTNNLIRDSLDHYRDNKKQWGKNLLIYNGILKKRKALLWINICTYLPDRSYLCSFVKYSRVKKIKEQLIKFIFHHIDFLLPFMETDSKCLCEYYFLNFFFYGSHLSIGPADEH